MSPSEFSALSHLLDRALELDPAQRESWLAALPAAQQPLVPALREMLRECRQHRHPGFMEEGPRLGPAPPSPADAAHGPGALVGPYRLLREIGRGGMGTVWLAERADGSLRRQVAVKLPRLAGLPGLAERMARERDIAAMLEHPGIARLYDAGIDPRAGPYLAMEAVDGVAIHAYCSAHALTVPQRLRLFVQVARAVAYAHDRLVVHRDLKPSNVLVDRDGRVRLLDFGIAKLLHDAAVAEEPVTQDHGGALTPDYASPEQLRGQPVTVQSDVYSLGVLLFELLTGELPHPRPRTVAADTNDGAPEPPLASSRARDAAKAAALRGEVDSILAMALRAKPPQRYRSAHALADDIERHLNGDPVLAQPDTSWYRLRKFVRRHRLGIAASALTASTLVAGAVLWASAALKANEAAERARVVKAFMIEAFRVAPQFALGRNDFRSVPADELLERAAAQIETRFAGQPRLRAELYGVVSSIFADMSERYRSIAHASNALELLRSSGADAREQAATLVLRGQLLVADGRFAAAEQDARRALALARDDASLSAQARLLMAEALAGSGQEEAAVAELDDLDRTLAAGGPTLESFRAAFLRAELLDGLQPFPATAALYRKAIAGAVRFAGPASAVALKMRLRFVHRLVANGDAAQAREHLLDTLNAMRAQGGVDDISAALVEADVARAMFARGLAGPREALTTAERARSVVQAQAQAPSAVRARADLLVGHLLLEHGQTQAAWELLAATAPALYGYADTWKDYMNLRVLLGRAALAGGQRAEAEAAMAAALTIAKAYAPKDAVLLASAYRFVSASLRMQARYGEAADVVERAGADVGALQSARGWALAARAVTTERALLALERGDADGALALLSWSDAEDDLDRLHVVQGSAYVRAAARCVTGMPQAGLEALEGMTSAAALAQYVHSAEVAHLRAVAGLCALRVGDRARAVALATAARQAFVAQPRVDAYYERPLLQLERRLALSARQAKGAAR